MFGLVLAFVVRLLAEVIAVAVRSGRKVTERRICPDCAFAHVQHKTRGRIAISCTFGGLLRPVKFDVLKCTDYRGRQHLNRTTIIGFASPLNREKNG
jgi:hypothetical protein